MSNPFRIRWLRGWTFQIVFMEGKVQVEAHGFGICLRTALNPGESPTAAADRLVLAEDRRRRALYQAWIKGQTLPYKNNEPLQLEAGLQEAPDSLVVVDNAAVAA
jgi:hypothetical protein|tara:strand:- start:1411 stop:1725 length:315 start_codon:yes stop_codon:yes gene_type:complete